MRSREEIEKIGFKSVGKNVLISEHCSIYNAQNITIGDHVRIDDFCILSAGAEGIEIRNHIHIACYVSLIGAEKITLEDYVQIAQRTTILSSTDDFTGGYLVGPCVDMNLRNVKSLPVLIKKYSVIGAGSIIMPGVTMNKNSATGAMTFVKKDIPPNELWVGNPAKLLTRRALNQIQLL